jgi:hypothetical protein
VAVPTTSGRGFHVVVNMCKPCRLVPESSSGFGLRDQVGNTRAVSSAIRARTSTGALWVQQCVNQENIFAMTQNTINHARCVIRWSNKLGRLSYSYPVMADNLRAALPMITLTTLHASSHRERGVRSPGRCNSICDRGRVPSGCWHHLLAFNEASYPLMTGFLSP